MNDSLLGVAVDGTPGLGDSTPLGLGKNKLLRPMNP